MRASPILDCAHDGLQPGRLWSLWDMLKIYAESYVAIGRLIQSMTHEHRARATQPHGPWVSAEDTKESLALVAETFKDVDLPVTKELVEHAVTHPPQTDGELKLLARAVHTELSKRLFLFVPFERAPYYNNYGISPDACVAFPKASDELLEAGNCYAFGVSTASVFHAMRAAEIGVRVVAKALGVTFDYPIELAEWGKIVAQIEEKITPLKIGPRSTQKDEDLQFYSHAAAILRHFNNAWRIRASHARENFTDDRARAIIGHVRELFDVLAPRLSETGEQS